MEQKIDEKDLAVLDVLKKHGEYTVRQISKRTALAPTTVHSRLKKLKKAGIIKKYTIEVDEKKLGKKLGAYILINADLKLLKEKHKTQYTLSEEIGKLSGVLGVDILVGETDLIAHVRVKDIDELDSVLLGKIQLLDGVASTKTMIIIH
ncbi:winged helix-turn-helix transcriptional regulator [Candidatus Micrarchaeota archaeon]|nr:winged helix-turn-helix transcriptional regulator [Candidatus Micrarchaeota archaeon]